MKDFIDAEGRETKGSLSTKVSRSVTSSEGGGSANSSLNGTRSEWGPRYENPDPGALIFGLYDNKDAMVCVGA